MNVTILDGGMGQELVRRMATPPTPLWSTEALLQDPQLIRSVHDDFFAAGADVAATNSYALHRDRLDPVGLSDRFEELHRVACQIAVEAQKAHGSGLIGGSIGPLFASYRPDLGIPVDQAAPKFREIGELQAPFVDMFMVETVSSVLEGEGALAGLAPLGKPIWLSITVGDRDGSKLRSGENVRDILPLVEKYHPTALLLNCATPEAITEGLEALGDPGVPKGAYANGFTHIGGRFLEERPTVDVLTSRKDLTPALYADYAAKWIAQGASIIGGCCEVGPAHIAQLSHRFGGTR